MSDEIYEILEESLQECMTITGIIAYEPFYFIAGQLHRELGLDFERKNDFVFYNTERKISEQRPTYVYMDKENMLLYCLVSNKQPFIKNIKKDDILLMIFGRDCFSQTQKLITGIRGLYGITHCQEYCCSANDSLTEELPADTYRNGNESQLSLFSASSQTETEDKNCSVKRKSAYDNIKSKRNQVIKRFKIEEKVIDSLKKDFQNNFQEEMVF